MATERAAHEAGCALLREYEGFIAFRMECVEEGTLRVLGMKQAEGMAWARAERLAAEAKARAKARAEAAAALPLPQEADASCLLRGRVVAPRC